MLYWILNLSNINGRMYFYNKPLLATGMYKKQLNSEISGLITSTSVYINTGLKQLGKEKHNENTLSTELIDV